MLLPSATEIVAAVGLADSLVARSAECDWPPEVRPLPAPTGSPIAFFAISRGGGSVQRALTFGPTAIAIIDTATAETKTTKGAS